MIICTPSIVNVQNKQKTSVFRNSFYENLKLNTCYRIDETKQFIKISVKHLKKTSELYFSLKTKKMSEK